MSGRNYGYIGGSAAKRYPRYFRFLRELLMNGRMKVSSTELAERLGITPSQVRADLNGFTGIGQQGYGYNVKLLYTEISRELGVADRMTAVMVGGDAASVSHLTERFEGRGVAVSAHFCESPLAGQRVAQYAYDAMAAVMNEAPAEIAVLLSLPSEAVIETLIACGVRGVWNMTQSDLSLSVPVLNLPVGDILMSLMCDIRNQNEEEGRACNTM